MILVAKNSPCVSRLRQLITVIALHVDWCAAQETAMNQGSHVSCCVSGLVVVPYGYVATPSIRDRDQRSGLLLLDRERLLDIDVTPGFQPELCNIKMALWRRCDMNNVWLGLT